VIGLQERGGQRSDLIEPGKLHTAVSDCSPADGSTVVCDPRSERDLQLISPSSLTLPRNRTLSILVPIYPVSPEPITDREPQV